MISAILSTMAEAARNRILIIVIAMLSALVVGAIVVGMMILGELQKQADRKTFEDCMARYGFAADEPAPPLTGSEVDEYIKAMIEAEKRCRS